MVSPSSFLIRISSRHAAGTTKGSSALALSPMKLSINPVKLDWTATRATKSAWSRFNAGFSTLFCWRRVGAYTDVALMRMAMWGLGSTKLRRSMSKKYHRFHNEALFKSQVGKLATLSVKTEIYTYGANISKIKSYGSHWESSINQAWEWSSSLCMGWLQLLIKITSCSCGSSRTILSDSTSNLNQHYSKH